jgi:hypothetical protein
MVKKRFFAFALNDHALNASSSRSPTPSVAGPGSIGESLLIGA